MGIDLSHLQKKKQTVKSSVEFKEKSKRNKRSLVWEMELIYWIQRWFCWGIVSPGCVMATLSLCLLDINKEFFHNTLLKLLHNSSHSFLLYWASDPKQALRLLVPEFPTFSTVLAMRYTLIVVNTVVCSNGRRARRGEMYLLKMRLSIDRKR